MANRTVQIGTTVTAPTTKLQDFNSDGKADVVSRDSAGVLWLYRGNGTGGFLAKTKIGAGWNSMTAIVSTGDFNGDRKADIVARTSTRPAVSLQGQRCRGLLHQGPDRDRLELFQQPHRAR